MNAAVLAIAAELDVAAPDFPACGGSVTIPRREMMLMTPAQLQKLQTDAFLFAARNRLSFEFTRDHRTNTVTFHFRPNE